MVGLKSMEDIEAHVNVQEPTTPPTRAARAMRRLTALIGLCVLTMMITAHYNKAIDHARWIWPGLSSATALPVYHSQQCDPRIKSSYDDTLVVLKTGSSVAYQRAFVQLHTALRCLPHTLFISDVETNLGGRHFVDVIKELDSKTLANEQLSFYRQEVLEDRLLDPYGASGKEGDKAWRVDKFKFIPMVYRAWMERRVGRTKWFVFVEADTLIDWANMRGLLDELDADEAQYIGAPAWSIANDMYFAHGGSGIVLSHEAMRRSIGVDPQGWLDKWGPATLKDWYGDAVLALALSSFGINLTSAAPFLQGETPQMAAMLPDLWCHPVVSMHHVTPLQIDTYWRVVADVMDAEPERKHSLLWRDVFNRMIAPTLQDVKLDWDNSSKDWTISPQHIYQPPSQAQTDATQSAHGCARLCSQIGECLQWSYHDSECRLGRKVQGGNAVKAGNWISGWMMDRIHAYGADHDCADGADWEYV